MAGNRLEVRLGPERRQKLEQIAENRGLTISYTVRELIDEAFEEAELARRRRLVEEMSNLNVEDVPDPDTLKRQLMSAYDLPDLY